jgi:glutaredoxin
MKLKKVFVLAIVCVVAPGMAAAAIYKWVDANGVVTFRDTPPPDAGKVQKLEVRQDTAVSAKPESAKTDNIPAGENAALEGKPADAAPEVTPKTTAITEAQVELYTTSWCPYCKKAAEFLRSKGIAFTEYDIEKDAEAAARKNALDRQKGVPFALINGNPVHGFSEALYLRALEMKEEP